MSIASQVLVLSVVVFVGVFCRRRGFFTDEVIRGVTQLVVNITVPCLMLMVRNSFDGVIAFDENGIPISPKREHGFGTRSIVTFCEKNRAFYEFKTEQQDFILKVIFQ